jgi:hypothetical protein
LPSLCGDSELKLFRVESRTNYEVNLRCMLMPSPRGQIRHGRREP